MRHLTLKEVRSRTWWLTMTKLESKTLFFSLDAHGAHFWQEGALNCQFAPSIGTLFFLWRVIVGEIKGWWVNHRIIISNTWPRPRPCDNISQLLLSFLQALLGIAYSLESKYSKGNSNHWKWLLLKSTWNDQLSVVSKVRNWRPS